jgi:hypothetical protein
VCFKALDLDIDHGSQLQYFDLSCLEFNSKPNTRRRIRFFYTDRTADTKLAPFVPYVMKAPQFLQNNRLEPRFAF